MIEIKVHAKINWTLEITGKRPDGYHELDMLMHSVGISDTLTLRPARELTLALEGGPMRRVSEDNLVLRAARALSNLSEKPQGAAITLAKRIPMSAGMGGGSADAAAALVGLSRFWGLDLPEEKLAEIGLSLGADVPFFLRGGLQRAQGIGEILTPLPCRRALWLVILHPCSGLSTKEVYGAFALDQLEETTRPKTRQAMDALAAGDIRRLGAALGNDLESVADRLRPAIPEAREALLLQGAVAARMTGSGCAVYGLFPTAKLARAAWLALRGRYRRCFMTSTVQDSMDLREE